MTIANFTQLQAAIAQQPYPLLLATVSGAHLYGFPSPDSDFDLRGIHILPLPEVVGLNVGPETIERSQVAHGLPIDLVTHDASKFFGLLLKKNGYVLEQLYSPHVVWTTPEHEELKEVAVGCITRHHSHHYLGFARTQWRLFEKETPCRVKPLLYVYRVLLSGIHLMQTGEIEANLVNLNDRFNLPYISELIAHKQAAGEKATLARVEIAFHQQEYERLYRRLEQESDRSHLPESPSAQEQLHDLLVRVRLGQIS